MNIDIEKTRKDMDKRYIDETEKNVKYFCEKAYKENSTTTDITYCQLWLDILEKLKKRHK